MLKRVKGRTGRMTDTKKLEELDWAYSPETKSHYPTSPSKGKRGRSYFQQVACSGRAKINENEWNIRGAENTVEIECDKVCQ